jgi:hypothetical protein
MPTRVQGSQGEISIHKLFYEALVAHSDSLALSQLWLCAFRKQHLDKVSARIEEKLTIYEEDTWNVTSSTKEVASKTLHPDRMTGVAPGLKAQDVYLFVQGVSFIPDGLNISRIGQSGVGATKGIIGDGRLDLNASNITFLETNISFVDGFLRPWATAVSHLSPKDGNLRCDIELYALQKWSLNEPLRPRKSMVFKNAFPINIDAEEYNYTGDKIINRQVQFAFDRYESDVITDISYDPVSSFIAKRNAMTLVAQENARQLNGIPLAGQEDASPILVSEPLSDAGSQEQPPILATLPEADAGSQESSATISEPSEGVGAEGGEATVTEPQSDAGGQGESVSAEVNPTNPNQPVDDARANQQFDAETQREQQTQGQETTTMEEGDFQEPSAPAGEQSDTNIIDAIDDGLGAVTSIANRVQGISNDVTSSAAQVLQAIGLEDAAADVSDFNRDVRGVIRPVTDVIGTGQGVVNSIEGIGSTLGRITGTGKRDASEIAAALYEPNAPTPQP